MGFVGVDEIANIEAKVVVSEVLGLAARKYNLRQMCKTIKVNNLVGDVPIATKLTGSPKVPEYVEAKISNEAYSKVVFDLWKNVVHVAISAEAQKKAAYDVLKLHVDDAARELAKMENDQIATVFETGTALAGSDWGGANDPSDDVMAAIAAIEALDKGYEATHLAMHPLVYADLVSNEEVKKYLALGSVVTSGTLPEFVGLKVIRDSALTSTKAIVMAQAAPAVLLGDGPEMVEEYSGGPAFYNGYAIAKFIEPKMVQSDAIIVLTGVHA